MECDSTNFYTLGGAALRDRPMIEAGTRFGDSRSAQHSAG